MNVKKDKELNKQNQDMEKYDPNYTYNNKHIAIDEKTNEYPVIEATINGLLYPEKIKDNMDMDNVDIEEFSKKKED